MEKIKLSVLIDGETYYPPGWMYLFALAIRGCKWAMNEVESGRVDALANYWFKHGCLPSDNIGAGI